MSNSKCYCVGERRWFANRCTSCGGYFKGGAATPLLSAYLFEIAQNKWFKKTLDNMGKNRMSMKQELEQTPYGEGGVNGNRLI